jgi:hypothetical protein
MKVYSFADSWGLGGRGGNAAQDTEISAKVSDSKRSLSIIHVHCHLCI